MTFRKTLPGLAFGQDTFGARIAQVFGRSEIRARYVARIYRIREKGE